MSFVNKNLIIYRSPIRTLIQLQKSNFSKQGRHLYVFVLVFSWKKSLLRIFFQLNVAWIARHTHEYSPTPDPSSKGAPGISSRTSYSLTIFDRNVQFWVCRPMSHFHLYLCLHNLWGIGNLPMSFILIIYMIWGISQTSCLIAHLLDGSSGLVDHCWIRARVTRISVLSHSCFWKRKALFVFCIRPLYT